MVKPFLKVALSFEEKQPDGSCGDALVGLTASWARQRSPTVAEDGCVRPVRRLRGDESGAYMATTKTEKAAADVATLRSATLADAELEHLERMVQYIVRRTETDNTSRLDYEYWTKRLLALAQTHDLVTTQRQRVIGLLDLLEREMLYQSRRTAA